MIFVAVVKVSRSKNDQMIFPFVKSLVLFRKDFINLITFYFFQNANIIFEYLINLCAMIKILF